MANLPDLGASEWVGGWITKITDHWIVGVVPMIYNHRIVLMDHGSWRIGPVAGWCYDGRLAAFAAEQIWDPEVALAPVGYKKIAYDSRARLWYCPACRKPAYEPTVDCHDFDKPRPEARSA